MTNTSTAPVVDCRDCAGTCSFSQHAQFNMVFLLAWMHGKPLPECPDKREKYWKGQEIARW